MGANNPGPLPTPTPTHTPIPPTHLPAFVAHASNASDVWTVVGGIAAIITGLGVLVAVVQLALTRKFNKIVETDQLLKEVDDSQLYRHFERVEKFDGIDTYLESSRRRANRLYSRIERLKGRKAYRTLWRAVDAYIQESACLTDRVEIYVRKGNADEATIAEHVGYAVVVTYYALQDILQRRVSTEDYSYEGFRDLTRRIQNHAKLYPLDAELRENLRWATFPPLIDATGDASFDYMPWWALVRKLRIWFVDMRHLLTKKRRWS